MKLWFLLVIVLAYSCETNKQCSSLEVCDNGKCRHKDVFPLTDWEILGTCLVFIFSGLAGASGIGGGALFVMIIVTFSNFNPSSAVALSQYSVIGTGLTAASIKMFLRHPTRNRPLIDYDLIVILISPLLIGTSIGVIANISSPYWLILLVLIGILIYLTIATLQSAIKHYRKETEIFNNPALIPSPCESPTNPHLLKIYSAEQQTFPLRALLIIFSIYTFAILSSLIRGSRTFKSLVGLEFCTWSFWLASGAILMALIGISIFCVNYKLKDYKLKVAHGYNFDEKDIKWDESGCRRMVVAGVITGFLGSVIGIGGAIIMSPVLLKLGVRPEVMAASMSFMVFFTSTVSALQYTIAGKVNMSYALWNLGFCLLGSAFGVFVIKAIVDKYKRASIIVMALAISQGISAVTIIVYGIYNAVTQERDFGFHNYCE